MIPLGLRSSELQAFQAQLGTHHQLRVGVRVTNLEGTPQSDVSDMLLEGQVDVDRTQSVTRSCTVKLLDPRRSLSFDSDSPADTALFLDHMLHVTYGVYVDAFTDWIDVPVFTGPLSSMSRDGDVVSVEAQGKEALALGAIWHPMTLRKGLAKTTAIRRLLTERAGENYFSIPDMPSRLPKTRNLHREAIAWDEATKIARTLNRQLFYDGAGRCRLRAWPGKPVYTFDGGTMLSDLQVQYTDETVNTVWVKGGTPKGQKHAVSYTAVADAAHPLSPQRLGRNGVGRYLLQDGVGIQDDSIRSVAEAKTLAERRLADGLRETVQATFDALPIPHLEPGDLLHVQTDNGGVTFRLDSFSLPLVAGDPMTVGYNRRLGFRVRHKPRHQHHHRHHRHHHRSSTR